MRIIDDQNVISDRELIEQQVDRIIIQSQAIEIYLVGDGGETEATCLTVPWSDEPFAEVKGIVYMPTQKPGMTQEHRNVLLTAIAKARRWVDDLVEGRSTSFAEIAKREGKVERHVRLLAPLAFVSPKIVAAIVDGSVPANLTVTGLAKTHAYSWAEQEQRVGLQ
jgi:site-specific DNA recombinase